jgi:hypothetical protein
MKIFKRTLLGLGLLIGLLLITPPLLHPEGINASNNSGASVLVYGASVWGVRGYFAIHTWVATRAANENRYTIHQVIGWKLRRTGTALTVHEGDPDTPWFGNEAILLHEVSGPNAETSVEKVRAAIVRYPFADRYTMFPGPNSNSFTEWVEQEVPELELNLPMKAIGMHWMRQYYPTHMSATER